MDSQEEDGKVEECLKGYIASELIYEMEGEEAEDESGEKNSKIRTSRGRRMSKMTRPRISMGDGEHVHMDGKGMNCFNELVPVMDIYL